MDPESMVGRTRPITVEEIGPYQYRLLNGHHRLLALAMSGETHVNAHIVGKEGIHNIPIYQIK